MSPEQLASRDTYLLFFEIRLYWVVTALYFFGLLSYIFHFFLPRARSGAYGTTFLTVGVILHTIAIVLRAVEAKRLPYQTLYENLSWFAWIVVATYLIVETRTRVHFPGAIVTLVAIGACLYSLLGKMGAATIFPSMKSVGCFSKEWS